MHDYSKLFNHLAQYVPNQVDMNEKKKGRFMISVTPGFKAKPDAHRMYAQDQVVIHTVRM
jgi:hypothetical protein